MPNRPFRMGFWGTPDFAVTTLQRLINDGFSIVHVLTQPDKPVGRHQQLTPSPVKKTAQKAKIPVFTPANLRDPSVYSWLQKENVDLVLVVAYGKIIPASLFNLPRHGMLNIHPSLLPKLRGASPIPFAILQRFSETGVTIQKIAEETDSGDIFAQERVSISPRETSPTLYQKLSEISADLATRTLPGITEGRIVSTPQDPTHVTWTKMLTKEDGKIDWTKDVIAIDHQIRALIPWPGSWTRVSQKTLMIHEAEPLSLQPPTASATPGTLWSEHDEFRITCGTGVLRIHFLTLQGSKKMDAQSFLNGHRGLLGHVAHYS